MSEPSSGGPRPIRAAPVLTGLGTGTRTRAEQLAAALDDRIREAGLEAGEPVGTLESLREETGFAYSTVSEAARLLRDRGVLEIRPGRRGNCRIAKARPHRYLGAFPAPHPSGETWPPKRRGAVAQMGERCNRTAEVRGSIPLSSTSPRPLKMPGFQCNQAGQLNAARRAPAGRARPSRPAFDRRRSLLKVNGFRVV